MHFSSACSVTAIVCPWIRMRSRKMNWEVGIFFGNCLWSLPDRDKMSSREDSVEMFSERLLFALVLGLCSVTCHGKTNRHSSCGDIHNISFPFRLKTDPNDICGNADFDLSCENNRAVLNVNLGKYYVQAIDYNNNTIRLVDVRIQADDCSTLPLQLNTEYSFGESNSYSFSELAVFVSCENAVKSPLYIDYIDIPAACENATLRSSNLSQRQYSYVLVGDVTMADIPNFCSVDVVAPFSGINEQNISFSDIHNGLAHGFELQWYMGGHKNCIRQTKCFDDAQNLAANCSIYDYRFPLAFRILFAFLRAFLGFLVTGKISFLLNAPYGIGYLTMLLLGMLGLRVICMPCVCGFLIYKFRRRHLSMFDSIEGFLRSQNNLRPISYSYSDIKKMTKGFRDKLGEGGYGSVYKGKLRSGRLVAIKVLGKPKANGQEFINEVATIGRIHHTNVVQLIGYCAERSKRALVYDFMPNGSLEKYIFSQEGTISLSCEQMYEISLGVARGIEYLHRGCDMQILHFDIKPHNILLDEDFTPKVSDFGLAKLYPTEDSIVLLTAARGTMGYMAPELFYKNIGGVSYKADVYSFGMLLMEMVGRRRNLNALADHTSQIYFPSWIYDQFNEERAIEMGETTEDERVMVKKMVIVALWCIQMKPSDRLSMTKVVKMLEGNVEQLRMPPKPFLCPQEAPAEDHGINISIERLTTTPTQSFSSMCALRARITLSYSLGTPGVCQNVASISSSNLSLSTQAESYLIEKISPGGNFQVELVRH
ncbi:rust resistance kinase Lr10-like [Actinidia eriantha]|uniref:rust resistance kinase Lr10-like n=1 Tax=Actinidia eriantha TaxID=165200 RepID=UPI00258A9419|nr:rust resistance kinase Lr10-like [Actinidia eriantha]